MPRILRISPEMAGVPAFAPLARADADSFGAQTADALAHAGAQISRQAAGYMGQMLAVQRQLQDEDAKLDMQTRFNQLKLDFELREAELRDSIAMPQPGGATATDAPVSVRPVEMPDASQYFPQDGPRAVEMPDASGLLPAGGPKPVAMPDPSSLFAQAAQPQAPARVLQTKDYAPTVGQEIDRMVEESARGLKYPGTERHYRAQIAEWVGRQKIEALNRGIKLQHASILVQDDLARRESANTAVFAMKPDGTPDTAARQAAFDSEINRIQARVAGGLYSAEYAKGVMQQFRHDVDLGAAHRDYRNPDLRPLVIDKLVRGQWSTAMSAPEQLQLAQTMQDRYDKQARDAEVRARQQFTDEQEQVVSDLFARAGNGELTKDQLERERVRWRLKRTDYDAILTEMSKEPKEAPSNQATLDRIEPDTHSQYPKTTEAELRDLRASGALNRKDYLANLNRLRETKEALLNRGESRAVRDHAQAEQELKAMLSIPPLADKLDQVQDRAWRMFLPELRKRSSAYGGKENPLDAIKAMEPRVQQFMGRDAALSDKQVQDGLGLHQSWKALEDAKKAGSIGDAEYDTKRRLLIDQDIRRQRAEMQKAAEQLQEQAYQAGVPRPKGKKAPPPGTGVGGGAGTRQPGDPTGGRVR